MTTPSRPDPDRSWALNMKFSFKTEGKEIKDFKTEWELAADTPCRTCGTLTRRMAPDVKHSCEASCSEACDPPIVAMDGLDDLTKEKNG